MPQLDKRLHITDLKTIFHMQDHDIRAVDGVSFDLEREEILGLVGESGCGKTVTALSIMRLVASPSGEIVGGKIELEGEDLLSATPDRMRAIRGNSVSMIFQEPMASLNPVFTIGHQISEVLALHRGMRRKSALEESARLLDLVGMSDPEERVREYPFQLSGGLRQRAMIAMALACEPLVLIADEPTTALDVTIQAQILRLMRRLKQQTRSSILFITHDLAVIAGFADRVIVMYAGVIVEEAPIRRLFKQPSHPYTRGLLASVPSVESSTRNPDGSRRLLQAIPGTLPDPRRFPRGCRFSPRCSHVEPRCKRAEPVLRHVSPDRCVRCFLFNDSGKSSRPDRQSDVKARRQGKDAQ